MSQSTQELRKAREQRIRDTINLKTPDRVPFMPVFQMFSAYYAGLTPREAMYDYERAMEADKSAILEYEPDMFTGPAVFLSGPTLETLGANQLRWPGNGVPEDTGYQFVESENLPPEEYDEFIADPSDWMLRKYVPRVYGELDGLGKIPSIVDLFYFYFMPNPMLSTLAQPDVHESIQTLLEAAKESAEWMKHVGRHVEEMKNEHGFSPMFTVATHAPFDLLGDYFRGTRGALTDLKRRPETLKDALETATDMAIRTAVTAPMEGDVPLVFIPLHKGAGDFMSPEQYNEFYWPGLKALIEAVIDADRIPFVYTEGNYNPRLETIKDVPKGEVIYHFEHVDMAKAKETLGDVATISGGVPNQLLRSGTKTEVRERCEELIDTVGEGGGFIMDSNAALDDVKPENLKVMEEVTKEYGQYD